MYSLTGDNGADDSGQVCCFNFNIDYGGGGGRGGIGWDFGTFE